MEEQNEGAYVKNLLEIIVTLKEQVRHLTNEIELIDEALTHKGESEPMVG